MTGGGQKNDLRKKCEREKRALQQKVLEDRNAGKSFLAISRSYGIDRRTVKKMVEEGANRSEKIHSPLSSLAENILDRLDHVGIDKVLKECCYEGTKSKEYDHNIARAIHALGFNFPEIDDLKVDLESGAYRPCRRPLGDFLDERLTDRKISELKNNAPIVRALFLGVLPEEDFLGANLDLFKVAIHANPSERPRQILGKVEGCLWFLFGEIGKCWINSVDARRFGWNKWRINGR